MISDHIPHPFNHHSARRKSYAFNIVRRNAPRDLIGIQEGVYAKPVRQQKLGCCSLSRAVRAAEDNNVFHVLSSGPARYAGCNSRFWSFFSSTGPCVSAVGGGGASPMRLE